MRYVYSFLPQKVKQICEHQVLVGYVSQIQFSVYTKKGGRRYFLCILSQRYRFLCIGQRYRFPCVWGRKEGRKEEGNPWGLLITHTGFYVYASSDLLIHLQALHVLFFFFSFSLNTLCLKSQSLFWLTNLILCKLLMLLTPMLGQIDGRRRRG